MQWSFHQLQDTRRILLKYRKPSTPVAIIKGAFRETESVVLTDLENMENYADKLGMISTVIVGNSSTYNYKDLMINPRGYKSKYNLQEQTNPNLKVQTLFFIISITSSSKETCFAISDTIGIRYSATVCFRSVG